MPTLSPSTDAITTGWYGHDGRTSDLFELLTGDDATYVVSGALVAQPNIMWFVHDDAGLADAGRPLENSAVVWDCATDLGRSAYKTAVIDQGMQVAYLGQSYPKCEHDRDCTLHGKSVNNFTGQSGHSAGDIDATNTYFAALHAAGYQTAHIGPKVINDYSQASTLNALDGALAGTNWGVGGDNRATWAGVDEHAAINYPGEQSKDGFQTYRESVDDEGNVTTSFVPNNAVTALCNAGGPHVTDYFGDILIDTIDLFENRPVDDARAGQPWFIQMWTNTNHGTENPADNDQDTADQGAWITGSADRIARWNFYVSWEPPWYRDCVANGGPIPISLTETNGGGQRHYDQRGFNAGKPNSRARAQALIPTDDLIVRTIDELKAAGVYHKTYVAVYSDNSLALGFPTTTGTQWDGKEDMSPWIGCTDFSIIGPKIPRGVFQDSMIWNTQLAPLLIGLAGAETEAEATMPEFDAVDPLPYLLDDPAELDDMVHWHTGSGQTGFRSRFRLYVFQGGQHYFYKLDLDPYAQTNAWSTLSGAEQTYVTGLRSSLSSSEGAAMAALRYTGP